MGIGDAGQEYQDVLLLQPHDDVSENARPGRIKGRHPCHAQDHDLDVGIFGQFEQEPVGGTEEQRSVDTEGDDSLLEQCMLGA